MTKHTYIDETGRSARASRLPSQHVIHLDA